ncbi:hypothetical protein, partial [Roseibium sp.]|uniref:hypothetical protein n=1 Tax=Roseibium sp. TaxID=1936156 RepID=UPI003297B011
TEELLPLLVARVEVAVALLNLEETTHLDRKDAMQALDIKGSFYEQAALNSAKQSLKIATGEVTATQVGFPEFEVDSEPGRAD